VSDQKNVVLACDDHRSNLSLAVDNEILASLSQYYRSGSGRVGVRCVASNSAFGGAILNDAASVSSMESYGYSQDGTMPSVMVTSLESCPNSSGSVDCPWNPLYEERKI
jgi:hypothetical protein